MKKKNRPIVQKWIKENDQLEGYVPPNGNMTFLKCRKNISIRDLSEELAKKYETLIAPGEFFGDKNSFRLAFGSVDKNQLCDGLEGINKVVEQLSS